MKNKILSMGIATAIGCTQMLAQAANIPTTVKEPVMPFDQYTTGSTTTIDQKKLPMVYRLDRLSILLGKTTLTDVTKALKTGNPLYDGKGYYLCYSIPKYSHQVWLVTQGKNYSSSITELVITKGKPLPTEYCPIITTSSFPIFTNKIRLDLPEDLVTTVLGQPLSKKGENAVYLYQLSQEKKLKVQTHIGRSGLDKIKLTVEATHLTQQ